MENQLNILSSRAGFNTALRHFKSVSSYVSEIAGGANLADLINGSLEENEIQRFQVKSILNALVVEKFNYSFKSHNLERTIENVDSIVDSVSGWNNLNMVLTYSHPQVGLSIINPQKRAAWESILPLIKDELIVIYTGGVSDEIDSRTLDSSIKDFISILYGKKVKPKEKYLGEREEEKEDIPQEAQIPTSKKRVTPRYAVQVTNELFHNGNVEAWKKIIESFKSKFPDLDVLIWYENERINDIHALFKWGKVKHGGSIFFSVAGENIKGVSKLQRYLFEGASPRFENFLRGVHGRVLDLF
jgi:hypothetical protein